MNKPITVKNTGGIFAVELSPEALAEKRNALAASASIVAVTNQNEQNLAVSVVASLKGLLTQAEEFRKSIKAPFLKAGTAIDDKAKEYKKEIETRCNEIDDLISKFQREERARVEAERKRQERAAKEAQEEQDRIKAEADRIERERQAVEFAAQEADSAADKESARIESERLEQEKMQLEIDAAEAEESAQIQIAPMAAKTEGLSVRVAYKFQVTDIEAFYAWDLARRNEAFSKHRNIPSYVTMDVKKRDFGQFINTLPESEHAKIPGVIITEEIKPVTKAAKPATFTLE